MRQGCNHGPQRRAAIRSGHLAQQKLRNVCTSTRPSNRRSRSLRPINRPSPQPVFWAPPLLGLEKTPHKRLEKDAAHETPRISAALPCSSFCSNGSLHLVVKLVMPSSRMASAARKHCELPTAVPALAALQPPLATAVCPFTFASSHIEPLHAQIFVPAHARRVRNLVRELQLHRQELLIRGPSFGSRSLIEAITSTWMLWGTSCPRK